MTLLVLCFLLVLAPAWNAAESTTSLILCCFVRVFMTRAPALFWFVYVDDVDGDCFFLTIAMMHLH